MKLKMLRITKQDSIIIAATLGVALGVPLSIVAFSSSSNIAMQHRAAPALRNDSLVGPLAKRKYRGGDDVARASRGPVLDFGLYYQKRKRSPTVGSIVLRLR
jgi:hypothetical protein